MIRREHTLFTTSVSVGKHNCDRLNKAEKQIRSEMKEKGDKKRKGRGSIRKRKFERK